MILLFYCCTAAAITAGGVCQIIALHALVSGMKARLAGFNMN
jgi:hypothetical protein